jgi:hypothetical protein
MAKGFEESDADRGGEIEAAGGREHGNAEAVVRILAKEGFGEAFGFATEDQEVAVLEIGIPKGVGGFGGEHPGTGPLPHPVEKVGPGIPNADIAFVPVVHARAAKGFFIEGKSEGSDKVETGSGRLAEAGDVAGVWRNFGFDEDHMKHGRESGLGRLKFQGKRKVSRRGAEAQRGGLIFCVPRGTGFGGGGWIVPRLGCSVSEVSLGGRRGKGLRAEVPQPPARDSTPLLVETCFRGASCEAASEM